MKKILYLTFIILITIAFTRSVYAYFFDLENSNGNKFSASTLYFSLTDFSNDPITNPLYNVNRLTPGEAQAKNIRIKKSGLEDFKYKIYYSEIAGDDAFCEALQIEAKLEGVSKYSGNLPDFLVTPQTISTSGKDDWELKVVLNDSSETHTNKTCSFKIYFKAWQVDSDGTWGFVDEIIMDNYFISGTWDIPDSIQAVTETPGLTINSIPEPEPQITESIPSNDEELAPTPGPEQPAPEEIPELITGSDLPEGLTEVTGEEEVSP